MFRLRTILDKILGIQPSPEPETPTRKVLREAETRQKIGFPQEEDGVLGWVQRVMAKKRHGLIEK